MKALAEPFSSSQDALISWVLGRVVAHVPACAGDGLTSLCLPLPEQIEIALAPGLNEPWAWVRPNEGPRLLGDGTAFSRRLDSSAELPGAVKALSWRVIDPLAGGVEPAVFLGHSFSEEDGLGFPAAYLTVPTLLLRELAGKTCLIFSHSGTKDVTALEALWSEAATRVLTGLQRPLVPRPEHRLRRVSEDPDRTHYLARVGAARAAVAAGRIEKVVISRRLKVEADHVFDPVLLSASLAERYPACAILCASFGSRVLVAASPERLVSHAHGRAESIALAGTAPRAMNTPFPDHRLLSSDKDRIEHAPVVRHVAGVLSALCDGVSVPDAPELMELGGLQHLATPISGRLKPGVGLLDVATALHPTPAVAGWPRADALAMLDDLGETREGWYSGAMGWMDRSGDGELSVILRCAVLDGNTAVLAAGGGIVAASNPEAELAETELKLAAMLDSLKVA